MVDRIVGITLALKHSGDFFVPQALQRPPSPHPPAGMLAQPSLQSTMGDRFRVFEEQLPWGMTEAWLARGWPVPPPPPLGARPRLCCTMIRTPTGTSADLARLGRRRAAD